MKAHKSFKFSRLGFILLEFLDEVDVVELLAFVSEVLAEQLVLEVSEGQLVVIQDRSHSSERDSPDLSNILILKEGLDQELVLTGDFAESTHQSVDALFLPLEVSD